MRIEKKKIYFAFVVLLLLALTTGMTTYIFTKSFSHVILEDKSEQYAISYNDKKTFEEYLKKIGAFEKNHATLIGGRFFTLKKIYIVLTDKDEGRYREVSLDKTTIASIKIGGSEKEGTLIFEIYIHPTEKANSTDYLSETALFQILTGLRTTIGSKQMTTQDVLDMAQKDIRSIRDKTPFLVTRQSSK